MKYFILITYCFLTLFSSSLIGQNKKKNIVQLELDSGTIEQQFDYIITKSSTFKDFQLIRKTSILKVKDHTLDSLKILKNKLIQANKSITKNEGSIVQLKSKIQSLNTEIGIISEEIDSISLFGTLISKKTYIIITWSIIALLLLTLVLVIARFKKNNITTRQNNIELENIEKEFENFRKKALRKEQETMRKLQNEINKNNP